MSKTPASFKFLDEDITVVQKATLMKYASTQAYDAMGFVGKAHEHMIQVLRWFSALDQAENLLLGQNVLQGEVLDEAKKAQALRENIMKSLLPIHEAIKVIRRDKIANAAAVEVLLETSRRDARKGLSKPKIPPSPAAPSKPAPTPAASPAPANPAAAAATVKKLSGFKFTGGQLDAGGTGKVRFRDPNRPVNQLPETK